MHTSIIDASFSILLREYPNLIQFFVDRNLPLPHDHDRIDTYLARFSPEEYDDLGIDPEGLAQQITHCITASEPETASLNSLQSITILGGYNKSGKPENQQITLNRGEIIGIVGPTGSGKSRLLADIEWLAQGDTPTGRSIRIDGEIPDPSLRFDPEQKLVAQLSQNMNFIMDTTVAEFVSMHAASRMIDQADELVVEIIAKANELAGEPFEAHTPVTSLSGGQSRALMIADTAFLSRSPIVLIDEIENAGIDRKRALSLLVRKEKIVLIATHDPILALMAHRRLIIRHGGIAQVLETTEAERRNLQQLEAFDQQLMALRHRLRTGERLEDLPLTNPNS